MNVEPTSGSQRPARSRLFYCTVGALVVVVLASTGLWLWARTVFTQDAARNALATQLSAALGQPVTIGRVGASIFPRVTMNLKDVAIGQPPRIRVQTLHVGTDLRALLSRRIEHAALQLTGARIELPLPPFDIAALAPAPSDRARSALPVEIVSIDEIVLRDVAVTSGKRTLRGNIEVVPQGKGIQVRKITLNADHATVNITGQITDVAGPAGELVVRAGNLSIDQLLAFVTDFASGAGGKASAGARPVSAPRGGARAVPSAMNVVVSLDADSASIGNLLLRKLSGRARMTSGSMTLEPISFGLFGGTYQGTLALTPGAATDFTLNATVSGIDMAAATKFGGSPDVITGRLSGKINLTGRGLEAGRILKTVRGAARIDITNGTVKRLGLVRTVVIATAGRSGAASPSSGGSTDESFARLGATLTVVDGSARTQDLRFESNDVLLSAAGSVALDGSAINLSGQMRLSDKLSQQAGRDLVRYTQEEGRVTLPVTITGSAESPQVRVDLASLAQRALINRGTEELQKAIKKGLGDFFGR